MSAVLKPPPPPPLSLPDTTPSDLIGEAAQVFLAELHYRFEPTRQALLTARRTRQARFDGGELPDFRADTRHIRERDWQVAALPAALLDRRVEITGPVDPKMVINALNSGANCYMADFEDSTAPTWDNLITGQRALREAISGTLTFNSNGKHYALRPERERAVLIVRPRGWHLDEKHVLIDDERLSGALFDAGLFLFHNAHALAAKDRGPYLYLPKLQTMEEAQLWQDVLTHIEAALGLPKGQIKVTVLIETLPAAFEMDEILYVLRNRITGLNCGRWDYIFSYIKTKVLGAMHNSKQRYFVFIRHHSCFLCFRKEQEHKQLPTLFLFQGCITRSKCGSHKTDSSETFLYGASLHSFFQFHTNLDFSKTCVQNYNIQYT